MLPAANALSIPAAVNHASSVSFTQFAWDGAVVPSFANEIHDGPALLATLQALQRQFCQLAAAQSATEQYGQYSLITVPRKSFAIGKLPELRCLACCKPVAQARAQLANIFDAMDAGGQLRARRAGVCLV
jgi:hypothetical protein